MTPLDPSLFIEALGAMAVVLGLLLVLALGLRWWRGRVGGLPARQLAVVETLPLDARHRLIRIRDRGTEHLLVLGPGTPLVVDRRPASVGDDA